MLNKIKNGYRKYFVSFSKYIRLDRICKENGINVHQSNVSAFMSKGDNSKISVETLEKMRDACNNIAKEIKEADETLEKDMKEIKEEGVK